MSHEIAEMVVDPQGDSSNPEVCDPCGPINNTVWLDYFDDFRVYISSSKAPLQQPPADFAFYINAIVKPGYATDSNSNETPAPDNACNYEPPY